MDFKNFKKEYVVIVAIALLFSLMLFGCVSQTAAPTAAPTVSPSPSLLPSPLPSLAPSPSSSSSPSPEPALVDVVFVINNGTGNYSKNLSVANGTSVLAALEANFAVSKKEYSFGALVTAIDGLEQNDSTQKYWQFYADGTLASVGAGDFKLVKSAVVEWRYEKTSFS